MVEAVSGIEEVAVEESDLAQIPGVLEEALRAETGAEYYVYDEQKLEEFYEKTCRDYMDWMEEG